MATKKAPAKKSAAKKTSAKKKAPAVRKNTAPATKKGNVDIVVRTKGKTFEFSVAPDAIETIFQEIGLTSTNTATKIAATANGKTVEKVLNVHMARRVFRQSIPRTLIAKSIRMALGV